MRTKRQAIITNHKHRIRFELALEVFDDPFALSEQDRIENGEARWRVVGTTANRHWRLMVACTMRLDGEQNEIVRIISARRASRQERKIYEHGQI